MTDTTDPTKPVAWWFEAHNSAYIFFPHEKERALQCARLRNVELKPLYDASLLSEYEKATARSEALEAEVKRLREAFELPHDVVESLLAIGPVEWGVSLTQSDEKHASDLLDTLRLTREYFDMPVEETGIHGVYLEGSGVVLAHTGMSPNSSQHARILAGAWNQLVEMARALEAPR